jgi:hypothetical protein
VQVTTYLIQELLRSLFRRLFKKKIDELLANSLSLPDFIHIVY